ncbi:hypothetical protein V8C86DRAFT_2437793 [Haematococcus lacustris]
MAPAGHLELHVGRWAPCVLAAAAQAVPGLAPSEAAGLLAERWREQQQQRRSARRERLRALQPAPPPRAAATQQQPLAMPLLQLPHQLRLALPSAATLKLRDQALMRAIMAASSVGEVRGLVGGSQAVLNPVHVCALMVRPPGAWTAAALQQAELSMRGNSWKPRQLGTLLRALGRLQLDPGTAWLDLACSACISALAPWTNPDAPPPQPPQPPPQPPQLSHQPTHPLPPTSWQLGGADRLRAAAGGPWRLGAPPWPPQVACQQQVSMAWGLARLQHNVPPAWASVITTYVSGQWGQLDRHSAANLVWAMATLGVDPPAAWMKLSVLLWAMATWGWRPAEVWLRSWLSAAHHSLPGADPEHTARSWWALASLGVTPPRRWMRSLYQHTMAQELSTCMAALARLHHAPEPAWMDLLWSESYPRLQHFSGRQLVVLLWAAVKLQCPPPEQWMRRYCRVSLAALPSLSPATLANLASVATLQSGAWGRVAVTGPQLVGMRASNVAGLAYGLAQLQLHPSSAWQAALVAAVERHLSQGLAEDRVSLGKLMFAAHAFGVPASVYRVWDRLGLLDPDMECNH